MDCSRATLQLQSAGSPLPAYCKRYPYVHGYFVASFPYFNPTGFVYVCILRKSTFHCLPALHYSVDLRIQTYTEPVALKYGKLATKCPWMCGYFYSVHTNADQSQRRVFLTCAAAARLVLQINRRECCGLILYSLKRTKQLILPTNLMVQVEQSIRAA